MKGKKVDIINAANKSGFNLEFKAKRELDNEGYDTDVGKYYEFNDDHIEIDIFSAKYQGRYLVGECKGSSPDSNLILVKECSKKKHFNDRGLQIGESKNRLVQFGATGWEPFKTITGDFYNNNFNKISKSDDKNNFFKAQKQISDGIYALSEEVKNNTEGCNYITPFILTNAEIWVVDFNQQETEATKYKWVLHEALSGIAQLNNAVGERVHKYSLPIININFFPDFVKSHQRFNQELRQIVLENGELNPEG